MICEGAGEKKKKENTSCLFKDATSLLKRNLPLTKNVTLFLKNVCAVERKKKKKKKSLLHEKKNRISCFQLTLYVVS